MPFKWTVEAFRIFPVIYTFALISLLSYFEKIAHMSVV